MELFVNDVDVSIGFYEGLLGFRLVRRTDSYASLCRGLVVLGLGPVSKLPEHGTGRGFTRQKLNDVKGVGVEIVLELDDPNQVSALYERCRSSRWAVEPLQLRSWGLQDFRISDPDGYYLRVTHGNAAASESAPTGTIAAH
jgi:lactoylglutathione lyase